MAAFDTDVIVRVLVGDDPAQTRAAERAFSARASSDRGLADYLILGKARTRPGGTLVTFDRKLARDDGVTLL